MLPSMHETRRSQNRGVKILVAVAMLSCLADSALAQSSFATLPPGSALPSDANCAARVRRSSWEPRPENFLANNTNVYAQGDRLSGSDLQQYGYEQRVTGNFTGTTDEIIQWAACKWGIDENIARAQTAVESWWHMSTVGDNGESFGLMQVRQPDWGWAFNNGNGDARTSSPFNMAAPL